MGVGLPHRANDSCHSVPGDDLRAVWRARRADCRTNMSLVSADAHVLNEEIAMITGMERTSGQFTGGESAPALGPAASMRCSWGPAHRRQGAEHSRGREAAAGRPTSTSDPDESVAFRSHRQERQARVLIIRRGQHGHGLLHAQPAARGRERESHGGANRAVFQGFRTGGGRDAERRAVRDHHHRGPRSFVLETAK